GVGQGRVPGTRADRQAVVEPQLLGIVAAAVGCTGADAVVGAGHADVQRAAAGQRVVRLALGLGVVGVEAKAQAVVDPPVDVEADLVGFVLLRVALLLHAEVLERRGAGGGDIADVDRGGDPAAAVELDVRVGVVLQPHAHLAALFGDLVGRVGVVQGEHDVLVGRELQHGLRVDALALEVRERVADVVRPRVQLTHLRGVDHGGVAGHRAGPFLHVPCVLGGLGRAGAALLLAGAQADAPGLVRIGVAEDAGHFRGDVGAERLRLVVDALDAGAGDHLAAAVVERTRGEDVDGGADAAGGNMRLAGLVDLQAADRLRRQLREVERAGTTVHAAHCHLPGRSERVRAGDLAAVEGDHVELRAEAARGDLGAFAVAALDRDAGDALQGLCKVGVGELADVLGADRVHDARGISLDVHRLVEAAAQAGDLHGVELGCILRVLRERRVDLDLAADYGEHRPRAEFLQLMVHWGESLALGGWR